MGEIELLDLYWTSAGPADVHVGREWSTFEWADRCAQAARVGFRGLGLWHADIEHQLETRTLADMKRIFDDSGLIHLQLSFWPTSSSSLVCRAERTPTFDASCCSTPPRRSTRTTSRSATSREHRASSAGLPRSSLPCATTPRTRPTRRSCTNSCRST